jgi:GntR family transcriptional regulator, trigonelline degradation regulator
VHRASDDEVEELAAQVVPPETELQARLDAVWRFDEILRTGCRNPLLQGILEPLHARIHALRRLSLSIPGRADASNQEYLELVAAVRDRSPERAAAAAHRHVRAAAEAALEAIETLEAGVSAKPRKMGELS